MAAASGSETKNADLPFVAFIEKADDDSEDDFPDADTIKLKLKGLTEDVIGGMRYVTVGVAGDVQYVKVMRGDPEVLLPYMREALQKHVEFAAKYLKEKGPGYRAANFVWKQGVAGFGVVSFLFAPPASSPFWKQLMPDIIKHADAIEKLCAGLDIINVGLASDVLCRNGAVCAFVDPVFSSNALGPLRESGNVLKASF